MDENRKVGPFGEAHCSGKLRWATPALSRIEASEAEINTRTTGDGPFSTS
jgi:hypothetical protein